MAEKKHETPDTHAEKKDAPHPSAAPKEGEAEDRDLTVSGTIRSPTQAEQLAGGAPGLTISGEHQTAPDDYVQPGGDPSQVPDVPEMGDPKKPPPTEEELAKMRAEAAKKAGQELPTIAGTKWTEETIKEAAEKDNAERWAKADERAAAESDKRTAAAAGADAGHGPVGQTHTQGHAGQHHESGSGAGRGAADAKADHKTDPKRK